jgi:hypothetical protein
MKKDGTQPQEYYRTEYHEDTGKQCDHLQCSSKPGCESSIAGSSTMGSIKTASSGFPGLLTRFDTGHVLKVSSGAGLSSSVPALPDSQGPKFSGSRNLARHKTKTSPGTACVRCRCSRHLDRAGRAGYRSIVGGTGDRGLQRIATAALALSVAIA